MDANPLGEKSPYKQFGAKSKSTEKFEMNHTESEYINEGARYERAHSSESARAIAYKLRAMLSGERPEDQSHARDLIEKGRAEVRGGGK